ncbi:hypothetical protein GCM10017586_03920 [Microbacterium imperiale]|uniref:AMP-dependent synthetase/ligase domain-containing protein n=1 Tax=Microbacterium imperiale TaxID=33884 RepID=A0A9W6HDQ1_9MICO|nr:hypothetical protein GCM10017544_12690 [Microbacterium imperiale]GLJ78710.1 hypothetical protein GCM10017586_03920 [Microbacterium imperiale]
MVTQRTWADIRRHGNDEPTRVALSGEGWQISYGELSARATSQQDGLWLHGLSVVTADRLGQAVIDVLAAQQRFRAALILPEAAAEEYRRGALDAIRAAGGDDPLLASLRGGILTTTSGSTGAPKVVVHDPAGIDRFIEWARERLGIGSETVTLSLSPVNFDVALLDVWAVLSAGGRVHFASSRHLTDGQALGRIIDREGVTMVQSVPALLTLIAGTGAVHHGVNVVVSTGDFFPVPNLRQLETAFPDAERLSVYGSTETNDTFVCDLSRAANGELGSALPGVEYSLEGGELVVHSPYQALGYVNMTAAVWVKRSGRRWFRTGDGAELTDDGGVRLRGRIDRVRKVRGHRVSLDDIEASLRSHPDVTDALAIDAGDVETRVEAIVRTLPGHTTTSLALRSWLGERLPTAAIPSRIWLTASPFQQTPTGKTDRRATHQSLTEKEAR